MSRRKQALWSRALGFAALFSGAALLGYLLFNVSLRLTLAVTTALLVSGVWLALHRATPGQRSVIARTALVGAIAGVLATVAYDLSRWGLSQLDPAPFNPFGAWRAFGTALVGADSSDRLTMGVGFAFHALNGTSFGIAFAFLFGRRGVLFGIVWGLVLEMFQVTLYPGWLNIEAYEEFIRVSALGHIVYGAVLGWLVGLGWRRLDLDGSYASRSTNEPS